ncbi:MAG TPA: hypothetical protein VK547_09580 [Candidatus Udaeobacter sp.]|nr:hypothetical protein [Candidatus Udaeobacter sp.]
MTEVQNGARPIPGQVSGPGDRPPVGADDLDVPEFLKDGERDQAEKNLDPGSFPQVTDSPSPADLRETAAAVEAEEDVDEPRRPFHRTRTVASHRVTRGAARQAVYLGAGVTLARSRRRDAVTTARHERMLRAAEAVGDHATALLWADKAAKHRQDRHKRRMALLHAPVHAAKAAAYGTAGTAAGLLLLGVCLAVANHDGQQAAMPLMDAVAVVRFLFVLVSVAFAPAVGALVLVGLLTLWSLGRKGAQLPAWLATAGAADVDVVIDETTIARALEALRIPQVTAHIKAGLPFQYLTTARKDGRGTHAILRLPAGVAAEQIARRRTQLATGLFRAATEVWPTTGAEAGILDLWIADKGALAEGAGQYPLLHEGVTDVFKGLVVGKTLRGDPVVMPVMERNTITGGMPGQGKSSSARVVLAGAALDPTCEIRIWIPDANFDFEAFRPRCSRYVMGAETDKIRQIRDDLAALHAEIQHRGELLIKHGEPQVTRKLASADVGLHPLVCLLEEAHVAIQSKEYGKEIGTLLADIVRLGRKRGIHMIVSTQAPTKDSIPRDVTRNCSNGIAFAVGDHVANDGLLGQGAYRAGHRATELIPGVDVGTAVCKGVTGERSDIIQFCFISVSRNNDQITPLIRRSLDEIRRVGRQLPGTGSAGRPAFVVEVRDLLDDLGGVLGRDPVPIADVPALLRDLAPGWAPYSALKGTTLRERLAEDYGIKVPSTGNRWPLDPAAVREAIARRQGAGQPE